VTQHVVGLADTAASASELATWQILGEMGELGIIRAAGATEEIEIEIVGESLFNDGFAVVLFSVLLTVATGGHGHGASVGPSMVLGLLAKEVVGGVGLGLAFGYLGYLALKTLDAPDLELLISLAIVMAISSVAFQFHFSAPLGSVVAGLLIGNRGRRFAMSDPTRRHLDIVWNFIEESLNGILFLLIGLKFVSIPLDVSAIGAGLILAPLVVAARFAAVGSLLSIPTLGEDLPLGARRILTWGGLKGGISIALAMSIPDLPGRDAVLTVTYMAVVFSIAVQGLSVGKLIEFVGDDRAPVGGDA
ncbi:MAG: cation:proton antiporter, partial [Bradymonadaceae bacterium]